MTDRTPDPDAATAAAVAQEEAFIARAAARYHDAAVAAITAAHTPSVQPGPEHAPAPCQWCPWLLDNHTRRHPDGWYTKANRRRLWAGLRRGESMACHPTDPTNPVSQAARAAGYRPAPPHSQVRECTGALVLVQREAQIFSDLAGSVADYRRLRRNGLVREGLIRIVERYLFGGTPFGGRKLPKPDLNAPVGHTGLSWPVDPPDTPK